MLFMMQLWLHKVQRCQKPVSSSFCQNVTNISSASMGKSKNLLKRLFRVILMGSTDSAYAAAHTGAHFLCCREQHLSIQTKQGTNIRLICHSLLNLPEIYCQLDSISLCLLIWLKGWFIKAQHRTESCTLVRGVMSCRHISFSFPTWLWAIAQQGEDLRPLVWHTCTSAGDCWCWLQDQPAAGPSKWERRYIIYWEVSGSCRKTKGSTDERGRAEWEMTMGRTIKMARK